VKPQAASFDRAAWEGEIALSGAFRKYPGVLFPSVILQAQDSNSRLVSSEAPRSPPPPITAYHEAQTAPTTHDLIPRETFQAPSAASPAKPISPPRSIKWPPT